MPIADSTSVLDGRSHARWLRMLVFAFCVLLLAASALHQWRVREDALRRGEIDAGMLANSLAQHATDTFEISDVLLTALADRLKTLPSRSLDDLYQLSSELERQVRSAPRIRSLVAFDHQGRQFASSQPQVPDWFDVSEKPAFRAHRSVADEAIRIGTPTISPSTKDWLITVTRRWNNSDGSFGGMVMATIRVEYFSRFYSDFSVDGDAGISLLTGDNRLLARYPLPVDRLGADFSDVPWIHQTLDRMDGTLRFVSTIDGVARVSGFRRTQDIPLLMVVGVSQSSIVARWLPGCILFMCFATALAIGLGIGGWHLVAKIDARILSERRWSDLAMTDALTGIRNRRAFDEIARDAWAAGTARCDTLSLLLIDVDHFKAFNDTYGHPAGDACLRAIAEVLGTVAKRSGDCPARYGGEEFALLLPETGAASALRIGERIRQAVLQLDIAHASSKTMPVVSISLGLATETFHGPAAPAGTLDALIARADRALYRAKLHGRNRLDFEAASSIVADAA